MRITAQLLHLKLAGRLDSALGRAVALKTKHLICISSATPFDRLDAAADPCLCWWQGMIGREPEEVAKFLAKTAGLDKTIVGEYLGEREDQALRVMHAYVDALDFTGLEFDEAIRCGGREESVGVPGITT